jgi:uncharacterized phage-associated protein
MLREIKFSPERSAEALLYLAAQLNRPTIHELLKLRYFADKLHLARYGYMASGDDYVAMEFGPVASSTYNLLKAARGDQSGWLHPRFYEVVAEALRVLDDRRTVVPLRGANNELLSAAERESLDQAIAQYGGMNFDERTKISHDAAWDAAHQAAEQDEVGASPMPIETIARTLDNAEEVISHLRT